MSDQHTSVKLLQGIFSGAEFIPPERLYSTNSQSLLGLADMSSRCVLHLICRFVRSVSLSAWTLPRLKAKTVVSDAYGCIVSITSPTTLSLVSTMDVLPSTEFQRRSTREESYLQCSQLSAFIHQAVEGIHTVKMGLVADRAKPRKFAGSVLATPLYLSC